MIHWKFTLAVPVAVLVLAASCCCCCPSGGSVEFTGGDFADVPVYPGATQTTESAPLFGGVAGFMALIIPGDEEWKHYTTSDSELDVLGWYDDALPDYGWTTFANNRNNSNGLVLVKEDDSSVMLVVFVTADTANNITHIIVGRSQP